MSRQLAGKFRLWVGQPVNAPFVTPPLGLRVILVVCVLSVVGTILYSVSQQMLLGQTSSLTNVQMIGIAVGYCVLPILVAHTISTNRAISRPLLIIFLAAMANLSFSWVEKLPIHPDFQTAGSGVVAIFFAVAGIWLYRSDKNRVYYALISGNPIPDDISTSADEVLSPGRFEVLLGRIGRVMTPVTIFAMLVVCIIGVIAGISVYF